MQTKNKTSLFFFATKFDLRLKRIGQFQNFCCRHQKNASHTAFIYGNCMITTFFQRKRNIVFFIARLFYLVQIGAESSSNLFPLIF